MDSKKTWHSTHFEKAKNTGVDPDQGVIRGVLVCSEGEAKGHGVHLEKSFIQDVIDQGNARKSGLKARFGHPNMCSTALGTFVGRFKNFTGSPVTRDDGSTVFAARADLFLSLSAKETPNGDLYEYIVKMARDEPDMLGSSIVFTEEYVYYYDGDGNRIRGYSDNDGKTYVKMDTLFACDIVDEPAANDGMFSKFAKETIAGQLTEFLDTHPEIWKAAQDNPDVLKSLARYGNKIDEFLTAYQAYKKENDAMKTLKQIAAEAATPTTEVEETTTATETDAATDEQSSTATTDVNVSVSVSTSTETEAANAEASAETEETTTGEATETPPEEQETQPEGDQLQAAREEFSRMVTDFGVEIAAQAFTEGKGYNDALKLSHDKLKKQLAEKNNGANPVKFSQAGTEKKKLFNTGK